jgi:type IV secretion system protein VirB5
MRLPWQPKKPNPGENFANAPVSAYERARRVWFEQYGSAVVERRRYFLLAALLTVACLAEALVIFRMMPLKTVVPYVIRVADTGAVSVNPMGAEVYRPGEREIRYFLADWIKKVMTINRNTSERLLTEAFTIFTRERASDEFRDFINRQKPIERAAIGETRAVSVRAINFIAPESVVVSFVTETRRPGEPPQIEDWRASINFRVIPPVSEKEILENPVGLYVTHFTIEREIVPGGA